MQIDGSRISLTALGVAVLALALSLTGRLRAPAPAGEAGHAARPAGPHAEASPALAPEPQLRVATDRGAAPDPQIAALRARIEALEARLNEVGEGSSRPSASQASRRPYLPDEERLPASRSELRELVRQWEESEREQRLEREAAEERAQREREIEFEARYEAMLLARELELPDWRRDEIANVFVEIERRRWDLEEGVDPLVDDPFAIEAQWIEFDQWADSYPAEVLGEELWDEIESWWEDDWEDEEDWDADGAPDDDGEDGAQDDAG